MIKFPNDQPMGQTADLILRRIVYDDLDDYFDLNSNHAVMSTYGVATHLTPSDTVKLIEKIFTSYKDAEMVRWGLFLRADSKHLIGDVGFWRFVPTRFRAETGAKLKPEF